MRVMRSRRVQLVLLASTTALLAGCGDQNQDQPTEVAAETVQEDVKILKPGDCAKVGLDENGQGTPVYSKEYCEQVESAAVADHLATAPRYQSREDCAREHGDAACAGEVKRFVNENNEVTYSYVPALAGLVVGAAAGMAAIHAYNKLTTPANGAFPRPVPVYQTLSDDQKRCRTMGSQNDPACRTGGGGGRVSGYSGSATGSYGYGGRSVVTSNTGGRSVMTYSRPVGGTMSGVTPGRVSGFTSGFSSTARGGFGMSASGHAGGGG